MFLSSITCGEIGGKLGGNLLNEQRAQTYRFEKDLKLDFAKRAWFVRNESRNFFPFIPPPLFF